MRNLTIFALALIAFAAATLAQAPDTAWTRTLSPNGYNIHALAVTPTNSIVLVSANYTRAAWWKWNEFGVPLDSNLSIGYEQPDEYPDSPDTSVIGLWNVVPCIDGTGDCIMVGTSTGIDGTVGPYFPFAARITNNGDVVWRWSYECFTDSFLYFTYDVIPATDGSAILVGYVDGGPSFAIGINSAGESQWCRRYPIQHVRAIGTSDGGALLFGYHFVTDTTTVRIDSQGEILWANQTRLDNAVMVHPDTIVCARAGFTTYLFKMTMGGDTLQTQAYPGVQCYQLLPEPDGGWTMLAFGGWFGRFDPDGTLLWSTVYPVTAWKGARMQHADYVFLGTGIVTKTKSGPRGNPTDLPILPGWLDPNLALLSWRGAEWQYYQIYSSANPDGPFDQLLGGTDDIGFVVSIDSTAKFFRVIGVEQLE